MEQNENNQNIILSNQLSRQAEQLIKQDNLTGAFDLLNEALILNDQNNEALKFRGSIRLISEAQKQMERSRDRRLNTTHRNSQERKELEKGKAKILINRAYIKDASQPNRRL